MKISWGAYWDELQKLAQAGGPVSTINAAGVPPLSIKPISLPGMKGSGGAGGNDIGDVKAEDDTDV